MRKKNVFQSILSLTLGFAVLACSAENEQPKGSEDLTAYLAEDHPCYDAVGLADERFMQMMGSPEFSDQDPLVLPESMLSMDSPMVYMYIMDSEYRKGSSLKEIRQTVLKRCMTNKKL